MSIDQDEFERYVRNKGAALSAPPTVQPSEADEVREALMRLVAVAEDEPGASLDGSYLCDALADAKAALASPQAEAPVPPAGANNPEGKP